MAKKNICGQHWLICLGSIVDPKIHEQRLGCCCTKANKKKKVKIQSNVQA